MGLLIALTAIAGLAAGVQAQECTPLGEVALGAGLTSLVEAVTSVAEVEGAASLLAAVSTTEEVADEDKITLFAPTNDAFAAISEVLPTLSDEEVWDVLKNHVVAGTFEAADVVAAVEASDPEPAVLETLLGAMVEATIVDGEVVLTPAGTETEATVTITDVMTCAGVVHVIDTVLVPGPAGMPTAAPMEAPTMAPASAPVAAPEPTPAPSGVQAISAGVVGVLSAAMLMA